MEADQGNGNKHVWTTNEDELLADCLVQLKVDGKFVCDTGFKDGYLKRLQEMLEEKSPGCGLLANPHIHNRLRTMKKAWQIVYDMVYGSNTSGFGWNPDTQCVTAEDHVWEDYIKVHKKAGNFRNKCLPYFDKLTFVWGKDRATGVNAQLPSEVVDEVNEEEVTANQQHDVLDDQDVDLDNIGIFDQPPEQPSEVQSSSKRRRQNSSDAANTLANAMSNSTDKLERSMLKVVETMCSSFASTRRENRRIESARELYKELLKVEGLSVGEINRAHVILAGNEILMYGFPEVPDELKAQWIRDLI